MFSLSHSITDHTISKATGSAAAHLLFICHAGRGMLCGLWASLCQPAAAARCFPAVASGYITDNALQGFGLENIIQHVSVSYLGCNAWRRHLGILWYVGPLHSCVCRHILRTDGHVDKWVINRLYTLEEYFIWQMNFLLIWLCIISVALLDY